MWSGVKEWAHRHRYKLGGAGLVVAGVAGYLWLVPEHNPFCKNTNEATSAFSSQRSEIGVEDDDWNVSTTPTERSAANAQQKASAQRSRILLRVRKEFAVQAIQFLPLLHSKILRVVDFDHAYDQLRELKRRRSAERNGDGEDGSKLDSNQLWEQIKDSSFTYLFVTTYICSVMCTLLRIQLHIQARVITSNIASNAEATTEDFFERIDTDLLKQLVNSTYSPLFGEGLKNLATFVRGHVTRELSDWCVCDTNRLVEYDQLISKINNIRRSCEASIPVLLSSMCLLPPSERETPELNDGGVSSKVVGVGPDSLVSTLLAQTWDVVDSPLFCNVCVEAIDTCFRHISAKLREKVFLPSEGQNLAGEVSMRTPPIASLLPQIKAITKEILPVSPVASSGNVAAPKALSSSSALLTAEVRDIASGIALDALCVALFDAVEASS